MPIPARPKIYHIVHADRLASIIADGFLWSDAEIIARGSPGTTIGMSNIKARRLRELTLSCHPDIHVGECAPFYFCPRSVMLFLIHKQNEELAYRGGQSSIVHLEADLYNTVAWANAQGRRWAFTLSNAGAYYFEDRSSLDDLGDINWDSVSTNQWAGAAKEGKQAEFLVETSFPWELVERIGVISNQMVQPVAMALNQSVHRPAIEIRREWYY